MKLPLYLLRRLLLGIPVLLGVSLLVFLALHLAPGNPAQMLLGPLATRSELHAITIQLGLNQPLPIQYFDWLNNALQGNLGWSIMFHQSVSSLVFQKLSRTLILASASFVIATIFGLLIGIMGAIRPRGVLNFFFNVATFTSLSIPVFWLSLIFILVFGLTMRLFPTGGMYTVGNGHSLGQLFYHLLLPAIALALAPMAVIAQITQVAVSDELHKQYINTAKAKGVPPLRVIIIHGVRNALIPIVTTLGLEINYLIGGDVLVENVFSWPGIGQLLVQSVLNRDYPVILGATLVLATIFVVVNLLIDTLYGVIDPRVESHG